MPMHLRTSRTSRTSRYRRFLPWRVLPLLSGLLLAGAAHAQLFPTSNDPTTTDNQTTSAPLNAGLPLSAVQSQTQSQTQSPDRADQDPLNGVGVAGANVALSADQIQQILEGNPDLVVEIKGQIADRLTEQGTPTDANSISDDMLYSQIASNAGLRSSLTMYLRARGYVSPQDLAAAASQPDIASTQGAAGNARTLRADGLSSVDGNGMLMPNATTRQATPTGPTPTRERQTTTTDLPRVLRRPTPYNMQSMRDLYTQLPESPTPLRRFGSELFLPHTTGANAASASSSGAPLDVPVGPDYVLGPGDTLTINLWGSTTQTLTRMVNRDGSVLLPEAGSVEVAGLTLGRAQALFESMLQRQFRDAKIAVTMGRLRSVRVYVTGDVQRPGGYDLSSLTTPLGALYAAGGPTAVGSLRTLLHLRSGKLVEQIDLYDMLLHGVHAGLVSFESGDTLETPPAGAQIAISGAVRRPAIYELKSGEQTPETLAALVEDAGGFTPSAALGHITVERIDANQSRKTITVAADKGGNIRDAVARFAVQDGDRIHIDAILPYSQQVIYMEGHVARPGRVAYTDGMQLSDVLRSYRDLLPEPSTRGEIVRLIPPDLHAETTAFNLADVLAGNQNLPLQPFDTIRLFGRYELDAPTVQVTGEVLRPGTYPLNDGMTAAQLVRMAGGFKRAALRSTADLTSYSVVNGERVQSHLATIAIGDAVEGNNAKADMPLKPGDVLTIREITGWADIGESVTLDGQVRYPGTYGFKEGEHLSDVLRRAGGFRDTAYPEGAIMSREQVRELEEKSRDELVRQIETNSASARISPNLAGGDASSTIALVKAQQAEALAELKSHPPTGRMVIHIAANIDSWAGTDADIELRRGDTLTIPKRPGYVVVTGQVYNATGLTFTPGKTAEWYLSRAGGANSSANRGEIFIVRANGSVIGRRSGEGWFKSNVLDTKLDPGDVVVVPQKIIGAGLFWRNLLTTAQLASSIAITAAVSGL